MVVAPPAAQAQGNWDIEDDGATSVVARFLGSDEQLLGFVLTGSGTKQKLQLQKMLPDIIA